MNQRQSKSLPARLRGLRALTGWARGLAALALVLSGVCGLAAPAGAAGNLDRLIQGVELKTLFPEADSFERVDAEPPVLRAHNGDALLGYVFLNSDFVSAIGYSGKPIHALVAIDRDAVIRGTRLVEHHEPIVLIGIPEQRIVNVMGAYAGLDVAAFLEDSSGHRVDIVSGATVTIMVIDDSILRSAIQVARGYGLGGLAPEPVKPKGPARVVDTSLDATEDWTTLMGDGSVRRLNLTVGDINRAFADSGDPAAAQRPEPGEAAEPFIELHAALVSIPTVGRSLLGDAEYRNLEKRLKPGEQAILLAADGRYSFKGSGYVRGGIFDRFQVIQGDRSIRFRDRSHKRLRQVAAEGAPALKEVGLFRIPADFAFDPTAPWRLELLVARETGPTAKAYLTFDLGYNPPDKYFKVVAPATPPAAAAGPAPAQAGLDARPLWQKLWRQKTGEIAVLLAALGLLTLIFFFQNWLAARPRLTDAVRIGFLAFTLFGIGFYANAQLSVVNVMTFFNALITNFSWDYFLMEPLIFILWGSVAASLLFWGRGPFCGWLCPFGALQELLNRLAKALRVPQVAVPWWLHERLWPFKYMIFLGLFGMSLYSLAWAEQLAEVEPFKTAIVLKFARHWPYVVFALALLAAGLFIERFYCRYLCPLGAALAIPGRIRMFEWLKRYRECGSPCQRCAKECMVQAIHPEGQINPNECLYCMHCQVLYHHDQRCPVMIQRRLKRERRAALASKSGPGRQEKEPKTLADFMPG